MSAASIPADRAGGYARYLESKTVAAERGDYYLTPDGERVEAPGQWFSAQETLDRLGIDRDGSVRGEDFVALMEGRHPSTGAWLRPEGAGGGRGGGIDATFSAPKSVSVVWALADPWQREQIEHAHAHAVEQAVDYMRDRVPLVRRKCHGQVVEELADDLIAVEYRHTTARGVSGADAPDPQLHSHVVITSVVRDDRKIVAIASRPVFLRRARSARSTAPRSPASWSGSATRSNRRQGRTGSTSRSRASPSSYATRSLAARARSLVPPTVSALATVARQSAASCAISRSRTAAQSNSRPGPTWTGRGARPASSKRSDRQR